MKQVQEAYIVAATRTPIGRSHRGYFRNTRPDDLLVAGAGGTRHGRIAFAGLPAWQGKPHKRLRQGKKSLICPQPARKSPALRLAFHHSQAALLPAKTEFNLHKDLLYGNCKESR